MLVVERLGRRRPDRADEVAEAPDAVVGRGSSARLKRRRQSAVRAQDGGLLVHRQAVALRRSSVKRLRGWPVVAGRPAAVRGRRGSTGSRAGGVGRGGGVRVPGARPAPGPAKFGWRTGSILPLRPSSEVSGSSSKTTITTGAVGALLRHAGREQRRRRAAARSLRGRASARTSHARSRSRARTPELASVAVSTT